MSWLGYLFFACVAIAAVAGELLVFYRDGYKRGYDAGWLAAQEWIITLEADVDQERQKIWRKGE